MDIFNYDNRSLRILNILEENFFVHEKYLADMLRVSSKTIQNEIKDLNDMFVASAYIKAKNSKYSLYIKKIEDYHKTKNKIYELYRNFDSSKVRLVYIFKKLMNNNNYYLIDDLAFEMVVSRTTLNTDIKKLKTIIKEYDLSIIGKTNTGIRISGYEKNIRLFILENIYNYIYKEDIFDTKDHFFFNEKFEEFNIDKEIKKEFLKYLTISIDRSANDFLLNFPKDKYIELLDFYCKDFIDVIFTYIKDKYNIYLRQSDKKFLTICFATRRVPSRINKVGTNLSVDKYKPLIEKILNKIHNEFGFYVDISKMMQEFTYHIYFLMQRGRYGVRYHNNMKDMIKEKYPISYKMAHLAADVIESEYKYKISEDEICYLAIYFETFISHLSKKEDNIKILLITQVGPAYLELMVEQLKSIFPNIEINIAHDFEFDSDKYTAIISTIRKDFHKDNIIYQNEILDLDYLQKEIILRNYIGKVNKANIRGMESILISSLSEDTFFLCDENKTYKENLHNMISILQDKELVDNKFLDKIIEREKLSSMIFSKNIAFPHTINEKEDRNLLIALGVSKNGFKDNKDLKLIFLAAVANNVKNSMIIVKTYDELIEIMKEAKLVENISKIESYEDFIDYFIKNTNLYR